MKKQRNKYPTICTEKYKIEKLYRKLFMPGIIFDILFFGTLAWLFRNVEKSTNKKLDRVEIEPHTWIGMSGKTRYNTRYLGPIKIKTFINTSKKMVIQVNEYENLINRLSNDNEKFKDVEKQTYYFQLFDHFNNIVKYMNQIDRRQTLRCYNEWKNEHPNSFSAYQEAKSIAISNSRYAL